MPKKPEMSREELAALRVLTPDEVIERYGGTLDSIPMNIWQRLDERQVEGLVGMYMERKVSFSTDGKGKGKGRPRHTELPPFPGGESRLDWTPEQFHAHDAHYQRLLAAESDADPLDVLEGTPASKREKQAKPKAQGREQEQLDLHVADLCSRLDGLRPNPW